MVSLRLMTTFLLRSYCLFIFLESQHGVYSTQPAPCYREALAAEDDMFNHDGLRDAAERAAASASSAARKACDGAEAAQAGAEAAQGAAEAAAVVVPRAQTLEF